MSTNQRIRGRKPWAKSSDAPKRLSGRAGVERRARWLSLYPLCKSCLEQDRVSLGRIVDHVIPLAKGGADDESNLQTLCHECDDIKTRQDLGQRERVTIGKDGWPKA